MGKSVTLRLIELTSFYYTARYRSVTRAARRQKVGQSVVSQHVRRLETEFGITLFAEGLDYFGEVVHHQVGIGPNDEGAVLFRVGNLAFEAARCLHDGDNQL